MPALHVYELPFSKFDLAAPLLHQAWFDEAYIDMVLEGIQPGRVFVDAPDPPSAALLCHPYEFYVAGESGADNPLRQFIKDNPAEPDIFHTLYGYCAVGSAWESALLEDAGGLLKVIPRRNFKYRHPAPLIDWRSKLPAHVTIKPMNSDLAAQVDKIFHATISSGWGDSETFLKHAFGFCLLVDGQIASIADVGGISSSQANLGVETMDAHRKQGYATLVCSAAVEYSLSRGLMPTWDCDVRNVASGVLALKLGFVEETPFSQLGPEEGSKLPLSTGRWTKDGVNGDVVTWAKTT